MLHQLSNSFIDAIKKLRETEKIDDQTIAILLKDIVDGLKEADVSNRIIVQFAVNFKRKIKLANIPKGANILKAVEQMALTEISNLFKAKYNTFQPIKSPEPYIIMLVGLQGSGKTTTAAKLAYYYKRHGWSVGLVCADTFRAGAREQLMGNAQQIKVAYYVDFDEPNPIKNALDGVLHFKKIKTQMIIVDTSGRHMQEDALFEEMQQLEEAIKPNQVIFVIDGTIGQIADMQARAFAAAVNIGCIIVTKLDSSAKGGGALTAVVSADAPIAFYGFGEKFENLEVFEPQVFMNRLFNNYMQIVDEEHQHTEKEAMRSSIYNGFTYKDLYTQCERYLNSHFGNLKEALSSSRPKNDNTVFQLIRIYKMFQTVINSMTKDEMMNPILIQRDDWRVKRLSIGSGIPIDGIKAMIKHEKVMEEVYEKMSKTRIAKIYKEFGSLEGLPPKQFQLEITQFINKLSKETLMQLGGGEAVLTLFKQAFID